MCRNFTADGPNRLWLTDITEHPHQRRLGVWAAEPEGQGTSFSFRARFGAVWFFALPLRREEIEFSGWPEDVLDGAGVAAMLRFLVEIATASQQRALLTGETVRYDPGVPTLISHDPDTGLTSPI